MQIFRTKRSSPDDFHESGLRRCLSAADLTLLGIGAIIGTGIFVLTGRAAAEFAGPGIMISFVITGMLCAIFVAFKPQWLATWSDRIYLNA